MNKEHLKNRVQELFTFLNALKEDSDKDIEKVNTVLKQLKETTEEGEKVELVKQYKKLSFFNNLKLVEFDKNIPVLVELISLAKIMDIDLSLEDQQEEIYQVHKKRVVPFFIFDKNELKAFNPEIEELVNKELEKPSTTDMEFINKFNKITSNVKKEGA